jgi:hypothetical protein
VASDPNSAARRIAGHCNSNAGDNVLWAIGVDKNGSITGADPHERASWWAQVEAEFEGESPRLRDIAILEQGKLVVLLMFEADRAPFVVRNAKFGQQGGGPVAREVPWREGTAIRSAKRSDLLKLLIPAVALPKLEFHNAQADLWASGRFAVSLAVYAISPLGSAIVLPDHQARGSFKLPDRSLNGELEVRLFATSESQSFFGPWGVRMKPEAKLHTINQGDRQIILEGPGFFRFEGTSLFDLTLDWSDPGPLSVSFNTRPAGSDLSTGLEVDIPALLHPKPSEAMAQWRLV